MEEQEKKTEGVGSQTKQSLSEKREKAWLFTPHALPQVASQTYGPPQLSLILRDPEKTNYCWTLEEYKTHQQFAYQQQFAVFTLLVDCSELIFFLIPINLSSIFSCTMYIFPLGSYIFLILLSDHHLPSLKFYAEIYK